jgi:hypothetical protein
MLEIRAWPGDVFVSAEVPVMFRSRTSWSRPASAIVVAILQIGEMAMTYPRAVHGGGVRCDD